MADEKTTESRPVEPIKITVIGTGDASVIPSGTIAKTEGSHLPNYVTKVISPLMAITVRAAYLFFLTLSGFIAVKMTPSGGNPVLVAIQATDFVHLIYAGASVSLSAAGVGAIKDITTILSGLAAKYPLATGNV